MFPAQIRIWHWLNAIVMIGIAFTVFLREFWMNKNQVANILTIKLTELNTTITDENAVMIAKAIRSPMWEWHIYLGIAAGVLLVYRAILAMQKVKIEDGRTDIKMKSVRASHYGVMAVIGAAVITGLIIKYGQDIGLSKDSIGIFKELHEPISWIALAFIPLHIIGVFISDNSDYKGIVSKIISG